ncbi:cache and HAMP domain-containing protein [Streptomyces sp. WAC06614]|uniref:HAMP domain-containing protein n=1 Tax=Streptomyces sp. WAC06614 TaxID=2487416 RepID=UPI000F78FFF0|nr:cache and HAMP domain-containing protein [Streptomyces sp. WAC06614]RSS82195.1 HAMP domain-containing protein [Streptomyces sp. WAC06614]
MSLLGGIRPPITVLSVLLLALAGFTAISLGSVREDRLPQAVLTSQQHFAEDGAIALRASLDESVTDLNRAADLFSAGKPVAPDAVLDRIGSVYQKWRGTAVVEIGSGRLLAARGENLPLTAVDRTKLSGEGGLAPRMVTLANGETRLLTLALLSWKDQPQQLLVASSSLRFPGISLGDFRSIAVVGADGTILSTDGIPEPEMLLSDGRRADVKRDTKQLASFARTAAKKTKANPLTVKEPGSGGFPGVSGSLMGNETSGERAAAGYARLAGPEAGVGTGATSLELTVVAMTDVTQNPSRATDAFAGLVLAGTLLLVGALVVALLVATVQRPLITLFLESRRLTRGDLTRPVTIPRGGEAARIALALDRLRCQLRDRDADGGGPPAAPGARGRDKRRTGARTLVAVCAVLLLAWCIPLGLLVNRAGDSVVVPQQLVDDQRERTDTLNDRVRRALNEGQADLLSVAALMGADAGADRMTDVLEHTVREHARYACLYVLDGSGKVLAQAGGQPRAPFGKGPRKEPVALYDGAKEPVVVATAEIPGRAGTAVVGEFRIDFLNALLKRPGLGEIRVVDARHRVIGSNSGYRAFQSLGDDRLDALVRSSTLKVGAAAKPGGVLYRSGGDPVIAAAAPFSGGGAAGDLKWTVVSWQPAKGLAIHEYSLQNRTVLAGLLGFAVGAACLGWLQIIVVAPLRELARRAEALADGDRRTVLYPRHHDEVGAVTRSLEIIRQQLQQGGRRRGQQRTTRTDTGGTAAPSARPAGRN